MTLYEHHEWKRNDKDIMENYVCCQCFHQPHECTCRYFPTKSLIMIDKNIQEQVRILNEKGYHTRFCCESHNPLASIYIMFSNKLDKNMELPEGFKIRASNIIEHKYKRNIKPDAFEEEKTAHLSYLLEWCKNLPSKVYK